MEGRDDDEKYEMISRGSNRRKGGEYGRRLLLESIEARIRKNCLVQNIGEKNIITDREREKGKSKVTKKRMREEHRSLGCDQVRKPQWGRAGKVFELD